MEPLPPGSVIGVLGGGQLGRMLAVAAARLGFDVHVYAPEENAPAFRVARGGVARPYDDLEAVAAFARACDVVTYEFENVPAETARAVEDAGAPLRPGARALEVAQDRLAEKTFVNGAGAATVAFAPVSAQADLGPAGEAAGLPAILKTRSGGYDGKGQAVASGPDELAAGFEALGRRPCILEAMCDFRRELSVIAARAPDGAIAAWPLFENVHENGILARSVSPAAASEALAAEARRIASALLEALDYVGVLAVELFESEDGALLVNEIAPRVHNSGHGTIEGSVTSQFEQHVRAIAGWPLGDVSPTGASEMTNLIGADSGRWRDLAAEPGAHLHLYGKREARAGRKMGHVTRVRPLGA